MKKQAAVPQSGWLWLLTLRVPRVLEDGLLQAGNVSEFTLLEATTGFEPVITVLQTAALPLGYVAGGRCAF
jgi:hypothetical protein